MLKPVPITLKGNQIIARGAQRIGVLLSIQRFFINNDVLAIVSRVTDCACLRITAVPMLRCRMQARIVVTRQCSNR